MNKFTCNLFKVAMSLGKIGLIRCGIAQLAKPSIIVTSRHNRSKNAPDPASLRFFSTLASV
jgi:hypothetical protein